jgi:hypothetical protein
VRRVESFISDGVSREREAFRRRSVSFISEAILKRHKDWTEGRR